MSNKVEVTPDVQEALRRVTCKEDKADCFALFGYEDKNTIKFLLEQDGGLEEAKAIGGFPPNEERYCLLRINHKVEMARTTKFALVNWYPTGLPPMRKSILSTHKGQVKDILRPWHVTLDATDPSDLNHSEIMDKIGFSSGTKVHQTEKAVYSAPKELSSSGGLRATQAAPTIGAPKSITENVGLGWLDQGAWEAAIAAVKSDSDPTNWLLIGYENPKTLKILGTGSGGVDEMASRLDDTQIYYGYFRVVEQVDKSVTAKFGTLKLMTNNVSPLLRGKVATHAGFIQSLLQPSQVSFDLLDKADISEEIVMAKLGAYTGTRTNVTEKKTDMFGTGRAVGQPSSYGKAGSNVGAGASTSAASSTLSFTDESAFREAVAAVRDDSNPASWMCAEWASKNTLALLGSGEGSLDDLLASVNDSNACFALLRVSDVYDGHTTIKFVYLQFKPNSLSPLTRGAIGTMTGAIDKLFQPYHVSLELENKGEVSLELVMKKVQAASGSAIHHN